MNRLIIFVVLLLITSLLGYFFKTDENENIQEDFSNIENHVLHNNPITIYDEFYSSLYDELFLNKMKNEFEIYNIELYTINEPKHKNKLTKEHLRFIMLKRAKKLIANHKYSNDVKLTQGDFMKDTSIFTNSKYSHIMCMFYTVYYVKDTKTLFTNIYNSLKDGGYMIIHLVNKKLFDPVLEKASKLIPLFNPQRHSNSRITKTKLKFNKFDYVADWNITENDMNVVFRENFIFKDKNRQLLVNEHIFYMRNIPYYTNMAKGLGFELVKIIDLLPTNHDNSYLYLFRKM
jgi:hypothetical protein